MERSSVPDPVAAARYLETARTALAEAVRALNRKEAAPLLDISKSLGEMARLFRDGMLVAGLKVPLVSASNGARVLGSLPSAKKLEALSKAREVLARKRLEDRQQRDIRKYRKERSIRVI